MELRPINDMSLQEIFDFVKEALIKQGKPSIDESGKCMYRGADNCKCAAGHLIPDDKYNPKFEGWGCSVTSVFEAIGNPDDTRMKFIRDLQGAHDGAAYAIANAADLDFITELQEELSMISFV